MAFNELVIMGDYQEGFPGPRDWSPAIERGKGRLKALQTLVPEGFLVPLSEVQESGFGEITAMVEQGYAFLIKLGRWPFGEKEVHAVYVSPKGNVRMDLAVTRFFNSLIVRAE